MLSRDYSLEELRTASEALQAASQVKALGVPTYGFVGCMVALGLVLGFVGVMLAASKVGSLLGIHPGWEDACCRVAGYLFLPVCAVLTWVLMHRDQKPVQAKAAAVSPELRAHLDDLRQQVKSGPPDLVIQVEEISIPVTLRDSFAILVDRADGVLFATPRDFKVGKPETASATTAKLRVNVGDSEPVEGAISVADANKIKGWRKPGRAATAVSEAEDA
jgi:hypothetical protein